MRCRMQRSGRPTSSNGPPGILAEDMEAIRKLQEGALDPLGCFCPANNFLCSVVPRTLLTSLSPLRFGASEDDLAPEIRMHAHLNQRIVAGPVVIDVGAGVD